MAKKLNLGIIGISDGNGHPYSWSAIFNGYNSKIISQSPFPIISEYLDKKKYPSEFLSDIGVVTHIWTQDPNISKHVAKSTNIQNVCIKKEDMLGFVDAILLARDDAENHFNFSEIFLKNSLPIYIDKPFALSISSAKKLWDSSKYDNQIFTCSALQFAKEFQPSNIDYQKIGKVKIVFANTPKSWNKYAVHIIEPVMKLFPNRGDIIDIKNINLNEDQIKKVKVRYKSGISAFFQTTGNLRSPIFIRILGNLGYQDLFFNDSFYAFRESLKYFVDIVNKKRSNIQRIYKKKW